MEQIGEGGFGVVFLAEQQQPVRRKVALKVLKYESASAFAADVQRYLADEPVQTCPPSAAYRLRKFARRHEGPALAAALVLLALLGGITGTTLGFVRAVVERDGKEQARQEAVLSAGQAREAKETAEAKEAETRAVLAFVENRVFAAARPEVQAGGLGREVTLRRVLEAALPFVQKSFANQPVIEAWLRMTRGLSFRYLGEVKIAAEQFEKARAILRGP